MNLYYKFKLNIIGCKNKVFLVPIKSNINTPFEVKPIFYIYGIPECSKGGAHAYYNTKQVLICLSRSVKVKVFDGMSSVIYELRKPNEAIYIAPNIWRITFEHSSYAVLLVLSLLEYDEADYIRDYDKFLEVVGCI